MLTNQLKEDENISDPNDGNVEEESQNNSNNPSMKKSKVMFDKGTKKSQKS